VKREHVMPFGARRLPGGAALFCLWAPGAQRVELMFDGQARLMDSAAGGWYEATVAKAAVGLRYAFRIDGALVVPDPASRCNPDGVHEASSLTDPQAFDWPDGDWRGRPWHEAVIYELHIGCFTPEGTFSAAIDRLEDLQALGITAIELMPVAAFPGRRGWGYDGVLPFAPDAAYGTPDELKQLVSAAHARGLMVLLDVVYNHFGPDGNYLHAYAPTFFNAEVQTPWGAAVNFDGPGSREVRDFFIHNALYWLEEFRFDGLRIDAVHAMHDRSARHFIDELALALRAGPGREREVHLVLENELNDASRLARGADGAPRLATAQWNDDVHHALHVLTTGERDGYYADYAQQPAALLGRALAEGFAYQGQASVFRDGKPHGTSSVHLPPLAFVNALQTHDQVGNRAFGERLAMLAVQNHSEDALRALLACVLLSPPVPMLFMGEEWAASSPFQYFCDFGGELARAVTDGRRNEFRRFARFTDPELRKRIPDPNDEATFQRSKLDWAERKASAHARWLALYAQLLRARHEHLLPRLAAAGSGRFERIGKALLWLHWPLGPGGALHLLANLDDVAAHAPSLPPGAVVYHRHAAVEHLQRPPWSVRVSLELA
jgi:malto-oligosyltrehalose trehalohydrolase